MRERNRTCANRPLLWALALLFFAAGVIAIDAAGGDQVDELTGLDWETLERGEVPDQPFWDFVDPQRDYLRKTFGPDISTTLELFQKEAELSKLASLEEMGPDVLERKSLSRWPDPVVLHGDALAGWIGRDLERMRLYALHLGKFVPIPYQFDEFTPDGEKVLPDDGPEANPQDGNGVLDPRDEFLFMAHDLGHRVRPDRWIAGYDDVAEILVGDPLDGGKGWCYLFLFPEDPPARSPLDYATYQEKYNQHISFYVLDQAAFKVVGGKLYRQIFPQVQKMPHYAGGDFTNFIDRVKYRVKVRLLFGAVKITVTEDQFTGDTMAIRDGPVRCTRRVSGQVRLPMGFKTPKIIGDVTQFDTSFLVPAELYVPFNPGLVLTDLTMYSGTDLSAHTKGSRWYNSNNLSGFVVDGEMSERERDMDESIEKWRLATGPWGTLMNRSIWDPEFKRHANIRIRLIDDEAKEDPPEYEPGQHGMAYSFTKVKHLDPGLYEMELDWFFIPWFNEPERVGELNREGVKAYMDMYDNPLHILTDDGWFRNDPRPKGAKPKERQDMRVDG